MAEEMSPANPEMEEGGAEAPIPANAQHLGDHHAALQLAHDHLEKTMPMVDNPTVKKEMTKSLNMLRKRMNGCHKSFSKEYPQLEGLQEKDYPVGKEEESPEDAEEKPDEKPAEAAEDIEKDEKGNVVRKTKGAMSLGQIKSMTGHIEKIKAIGDSLCQHGEVLKAMCGKDEDMGDEPMDDMSGEEKAGLGRMLEDLKKQVARAVGAA